MISDAVVRSGRHVDRFINKIAAKLPLHAFMINTQLVWQRGVSVSVCRVFNKTPVKNFIVVVANSSHKEVFIATEQNKGLSGEAKVVWRGVELCNGFEHLIGC